MQVWQLKQPTAGALSDHGPVSTPLCNLTALVRLGRHDRKAQERWLINLMALEARSPRSRCLLNWGQRRAGPSRWPPSRCVLTRQMGQGSSPGSLLQEHEVPTHGT